MEEENAITVITEEIKENVTVITKEIEENAITQGALSSRAYLGFLKLLSLPLVPSKNVTGQDSSNQSVWKYLKARDTRTPRKINLAEEKQPEQQTLTVLNVPWMLQPLNLREVLPNGDITKIDRRRKKQRQRQRQREIVGHAAQPHPDLDRRRAAFDSNEDAEKAVELVESSAMDALERKRNLAWADRVDCTAKEAVGVFCCECTATNVPPFKRCNLSKRVCPWSPLPDGVRPFFNLKKMLLNGVPILTSPLPPEIKTIRARCLIAADFDINAASPLAQKLGILLVVIESQFGRQEDQNGSENGDGRRCGAVVVGGAAERCGGAFLGLASAGGWGDGAGAARARRASGRGVRRDGGRDGGDDGRAAGAPRAVGGLDARAAGVRGRRAEVLRVRSSVVAERIVAAGAGDPSEALEATGHGVSPLALEQALG
ncbi:hypothetical protein DFJ73DRAFT_755501 [Zopfochytrium polystomum]|nr:hypothetical protein DFJ73DRAFT_755501 [Zopfochytrium polystomum]